MTIFKTNFNQKTTIGVRWRPQALLPQTYETNSEKRFPLQFVNVGEKNKFAETSVCIVLVVLVYESAKIYTGPKIVRVLKRLGNTALRQAICTELF